VTDGARVRAGSAGSGRGHFFSITQPAWWAACELGLNPAVALLVLARFSGPDNLSTSASVNAIEKYTGIARSRARKAIEALIGDGLARNDSDNANRPRYALLSPAPVPPPPARRGQSQPKPPSQEGVRIWLPNSTVTGAAGETPPVERLRQAQDPLLLRLFVDLYSAQNLRDDGGISRQVYWSKYERNHVWNYAEFSFWKFAEPKLWVRRNPITTPHYTKEAEGPAQDLFARLALLERLNLLDLVPTLHESDDSDGEPFLSFDWRESGLEPERRVWLASQRAAQAALPEHLYAPLGRSGAVVLGVPKHLGNVSLVGMYRLRYRPRTALTSAWFRKLRARSEEWERAYLDLAARANGGRSRAAG
jgi:hypothetical protein